jgi:hypothetical protein
MKHTSPIRDLIPMMKNTLALLSVGALLGLLVGCSPAEDANPLPPSAPPPSPLAESSPENAALAAAASVETSAQPPAIAFGGATSAEGLPMQNDEGKTLDTMASLQYAAEVYERLRGMEPPVDDDNPRYKPRPPLTDLQQLVQYRVIRAVPAAPAGQKYVYDPQTGKVKLGSQ